MRVLVTGGAGYIGSVVAAQLVAAGHEVTVLDDLSTGFADAVPAGATGNQNPHQASLSRSAASSGTMSLIQTPIPDSVPARYFSFPAARRTDST